MNKIERERALDLLRWLPFTEKRILQVLPIFTTVQHNGALYHQNGASVGVNTGGVYPYEDNIVYVSPEMKSMWLLCPTLPETMYQFWEAARSPFGLRFDDLAPLPVLEGLVNAVSAIRDIEPLIVELRAAGVPFERVGDDVLALPDLFTVRYDAGFHAKYAVTVQGVTRWFLVGQESLIIEFARVLKNYQDAQIRQRRRERGERA